MKSKSIRKSLLSYSKEKNEIGSIQVQYQNLIFYLSLLTNNKAGNN